MPGDILSDPAFAAAEKQLLAESAAESEKLPRRSRPKSGARRSPASATSEAAPAAPPSTQAESASPERTADMASSSTIDWESEIVPVLPTLDTEKHAQATSFVNAFNAASPEKRALLKAAFLAKHRDLLGYLPHMFAVNVFGSDAVAAPAPAPAVSTAPETAPVAPVVVATVTAEVSPATPPDPMAAPWGTAPVTQVAEVVVSPAEPADAGNASRRHAATGAAGNRPGLMAQLAKVFSPTRS